MRAWVGAIVGGLVLNLAGCDEPGEVYQRPQTEVHDLLRTVEVPLYMFGNGADTDATVDGSDAAKIVWKITADDYSLMKFTATLVPDGQAKTRVVVDVVGNKGGKWGDVEAKLTNAKEIRALYLASMVEAVDSTLDGRRYDITATYPQMMTATFANANRLFPKNKDGVRPQSR